MPAALLAAPVCGARQKLRPTKQACFLPTAALTAPSLHLPPAALRLVTQRATLVKLCVIGAAILWAEILRVEHSVLLIVSVSVLWLFRSKTNLRALGGAVAGMACMLVSPFYLATAMGFLPIHLYNGEQGSGNRWVNYLAYPVLLLLVALVGLFCF